MCGSAAAAGAAGGEGGGEGLRLGDETLRACLGERMEKARTSGFLVKSVNRLQLIQVTVGGGGGGAAKSDGDDVSVKAHELVCFSAFQIFWALSSVSHSCFHHTLLLHSPAALILLCPFCLASSLRSARQLFFLSFPRPTCVSSGSSATSHFCPSFVSLFFCEMREKSETRRALIARVKCWRDASSARLQAKRPGGRKARRRH